MQRLFFLSHKQIASCPHYRASVEIQSLHLLLSSTYQLAILGLFVSMQSRPFRFVALILSYTLNVFYANAYSPKALGAYNHMQFTDSGVFANSLVRNASSHASSRQTAKNPIPAWTKRAVENYQDVCNPRSLTKFILLKCTMAAVRIRRGMHAGLYDRSNWRRERL